MKKKALLAISFLLFPCAVKSMDDAASEVKIDIDKNIPLSLNLPASAASQRFVKSSGSGSRATGRSTVRNSEDLLGQIKVQRAASVHSVRKKTIISQKPLSKDELPAVDDEEQSIEVVDPATKKRSVFLPKKVAEHLAGGPLPKSDHYGAEEKVYTEGQVWEGLKIIDEKLYILGKALNMTLEDLMLYRTVLEHNDLEHDYVMEAVRKKLGNQGATTAPLTIWSAIGNLFTFESGNNNQQAGVNPAWSAMYQDIKDKDPKSYELVLFEIMKELESKPSNSAITDLHTNLQNQAIQDTNESLKKTIITTLGSILLSAGTAAWGIYGQTNTSGACVNHTA